MKDRSLGVVFRDFSFGVSYRRVSLVVVRVFCGFFVFFGGRALVKK